MIEHWNASSVAGTPAGTVSPSLAPDRSISAFDLDLRWTLGGSWRIPLDKAGPPPAPGPTLLVVPRHAHVLLARPRQIVTLSFHIKNRGGGPMTLERELELRPGFQELGPQLPFQLAPGETATILAHVQVPDDAPAGSHPIRLVLRDRSDRSVGAEWRGIVKAC